MTASRVAQRARRPSSGGKVGAGEHKAKLSHLRRPADMTPESWQRQLRQQFGRAQKFKVENLGENGVFSEFRVTNPGSGGSYRVAIRGAQLGDNFCACPDFATNDLGTCKQIEFVLSRLERKRGGRQALLRCFRPRYSEIYLRYGNERQVRFRAGRTAHRRWSRPPRPCFAAHRPEHCPPTVIPNSKDSLPAPGKPTTNCGAMRTL